MPENNNENKQEQKPRRPRRKPHSGHKRQADWLNEPTGAEFPDTESVLRQNERKISASLPQRNPLRNRNNRKKPRHRNSRRSSNPQINSSRKSPRQSAKIPITMKKGNRDADLRKTVSLPAINSGATRKIPH